MSCCAITYLVVKNKCAIVKSASMIYEPFNCVLCFVWRSDGRCCCGCNLILLDYLVDWTCLHHRGSRFFSVSSWTCRSRIWNWLNPNRISGSSAWGASKGKFLSMDRSTNESNLSIARFFFCFLAQWRLVLSQVRENSGILDRVGWNWLYSLPPLCLRPVVHVALSWLAIPQHRLGSWLRFAANNCLNNQSLASSSGSCKQQLGACWCCSCRYSGSFFLQICSTSLRIGDFLQQINPGMSSLHILRI